MHATLKVSDPSTRTLSQPVFWHSQLAWWACWQRLSFQSAFFFVRTGSFFTLNTTRDWICNLNASIMLIAQVYAVPRNQPIKSVNVKESSNIACVIQIAGSASFLVTSVRRSAANFEPSRDRKSLKTERMYRIIISVYSLSSNHNDICVRKPLVDHGLKN